MSLVEVLGNNKSIKDGIYIRYCDKGGTDTTTEKWLSDVPKGLVLASEAPKQAEIDKLRAELAQARGQRDSYLDKAIERVRKCELPQRDVMRIRLDEAVGGLIILRDELLKQTKID